MITDINSYVGTTEAFETNWKAGNTELGANGPISLAGNYAVAAFETDRTALLGLIDATRNVQRDERDAFIALQSIKNTLMMRAKQFRGAVLSKITDPSYLKDLVAIPGENAEAPLFAEPLKAMARLWNRINTDYLTLGLPGFLTLAGGYDSEGFEAEISLLAGQYDLAKGAIERAGTSRGVRNNAMAAIYERMKQYRAAALAYLPENSPVLMNLPRLTPEAGTTPPPLTVSGTYDGATGEAVFTFPASIAKNILKLQARGCTGVVFKADEEEVIGDLAATATSFRTSWGLEVDGAKITVKIYVMTTTGNQNGGKAVKIVRPVV